MRADEAAANSTKLTKERKRGAAVEGHAACAFDLITIRHDQREMRRTRKREMAREKRNHQPEPGLQASLSKSGVGAWV